MTKIFFLIFCVEFFIMRYVFWKLRLFPKIKFVDKMPGFNSTYMRGYIPGNTYNGSYEFATKEILILRRKGQIRTLFHELGHWVIDIYTGSMKFQDWFDKYFTTT